MSLSVPPISWEDAVRWYRDLPNNEAAVRANYFDLPVLPAAQRFAASEEFLEMLRILGPGRGRRVLDLGAGHGVTSYALALHGWKVTAVEPDPSAEVGHGAIKSWQKEAGLSVEIIKNPVTPFPIEESSMDAVVARQVLHHLPDLPSGLQEITRILKPGGLVLTTRDHVADDEQQLKQFLANHPLQHLYGGENAHPLRTYLQSFCAAGLELLEVWGPVENILNFYPGTEAERRAQARGQASNQYTNPWMKRMANLPFVRSRTLRLATWNDHSPGRIYSILARKPATPRSPHILSETMNRWLPPASRIAGSGAEG